MRDFINEILNISRNFRRKFWGIIFLAPFIIVFAVFTLYPVLMSHIYTFFEWPGYGPLEDFVGLENYFEVISDPLFWDAFRRSLIFMVGSVSFQVPIALFIAILLNDKSLKGRYYFRTLIFIPVVMTSAVVGVIMQSVFAAHNGLVNTALSNIGLIANPINWLGRGRTALLTVIIVASWKWMGIKMIYWLAGLQSLPEELYDAAKVDGAGTWDTFRYITVPLLMPIGIVILLISMIDSLKVFDLIYTLTEGGPGFSTEVIELYIYRFAFTSSYAGGMPEMGYASTAAVFFGVLAVTISLIFNWLKNKFTSLR